MAYSKNQNSDITTALGEEGLKNQPWWVEQWMELINSYRFKKRLERAWGYAREGNVTSIRFEGRRVHARVQGTGEDPYKVKLWLDVLNDEDWGYVLEALTQKARWSAQLLAGIMPEDIERAFAASGKRLFPFKLQEIRSECNCPDKANPCKHISAIYFLMGDRFREDPFVLFQLRGRSRSQLLKDLANKRLELLTKFQKNISTKTFENKRNNISQTTAITSKAHPSIIDPRMWWLYKGDLNQNLVVITPGMEEETGLYTAGEIPLAAEPTFPKSHEEFINHLKQQGHAFANHAMLQAMRADS
tara:strand:+ start:602 stop:1507 length:906 start_codon:yes stop_codon:yes gene_type:complete